MEKKTPEENEFERVVLEFLDKRNTERNKEENEATLDKLYEDPRTKTLIKFLAKPPQNDQELQELYELTCWGSLGYCCGAKKHCFWQDMVREVLGISDADYTKAKAQQGLEMGRRGHRFQKGGD